MVLARTLLIEDIEKAKKLFIVVEGKKDETALRNLGFKNILGSTDK